MRRALPGTPDPIPDAHAHSAGTDPVVVHLALVQRYLVQQRDGVALHEQRSVDRVARHREATAHVSARAVHHAARVVGGERPEGLGIGGRGVDREVMRGSVKQL